MERLAVNFPLKLSRATVANADPGSLKSLHTLFDTYSDNILGNFESNRLGSKCTKDVGQKPEFF